MNEEGGRKIGKGGEGAVIYLMPVPHKYANVAQVESLRSYFFGMLSFVDTSLSIRSLEFKSLP